MTEQVTLGSFDQMLQSVFQKIIDNKLLSAEQLSDRDFALLRGEIDARI